MKNIVVLALLCLIAFTAQAQFSDQSMMIGAHLSSSDTPHARLLSYGGGGQLTLLPKCPSKPKFQAGWQLGLKFKMATIAISDSSSMRVNVTNQSWERPMHPHWEVWVGPSIRYGALTAGASLTTAGRVMLTASISRLTIGYFLPTGSRAGTAMLGYRQSF